MPLLGFPISQPRSCFFNNLAEFRPETHSRNRLLVGNDGGLGFASAICWRTFCITKKMRKSFDLARVDVRRGGLMIRAVATFEITSLAEQSEEVKGYDNVMRLDIESVRTRPAAFEQKSSSEDSKGVNEGEELRQRRISKANKGRTAWNKGRKHSPETLQRIKERTRLAMQDPKVKMKLVNSGHAQSEETRIQIGLGVRRAWEKRRQKMMLQEMKLVNLGHAMSEETKVKIGMGVRLGWERRRQKLMLQETCHYEWQNLIAAAARSGLAGEEELQWDTYNTLSKKLQLEWVRSVEERKSMLKPRGSRNAPKSAEQKKKISEAISAKWDDPDYRARVRSGLAKYHGTSKRPERKPRIKLSGECQAQKRSPAKKDKIGNLAKREKNDKVQRVRLKGARGPSYKDPFSSTKLEMLKNIRTQRAAAANKRSEAVFRAKLLISEAEKAAAALEIAARSSPHVQASLVESRILIAEAIQFIESIENEDPVFLENGSVLSDNSIELPQDEETVSLNNQTLEVVNHTKVNGVHSLSAGDAKIENFEIAISAFPGVINGYTSNACRNDPCNQTQLHQAGFHSLELHHKANYAKEYVEIPIMSKLELQQENRAAPEKGVKITKKWVRGKLVEFAEET